MGHDFYYRIRIKTESERTHEELTPDNFDSPHFVDFNETPHYWLIEELSNHFYQRQLLIEGKIGFWRNIEKEMKEFSLLYPEYLFEILVIEEDIGEFCIYYFLNGNSQWNRGIVIFPRCNLKSHNQ